MFLIVRVTFYFYFFFYNMYYNNGNYPQNYANILFIQIKGFFSTTIVTRRTQKVGD